MIIMIINMVPSHISGLYIRWNTYLISPAGYTGHIHRTNNLIPYPFVVDAFQFTEGGAWTEASSFLAAEFFVWVRGRASDLAPP